MNLRGNLRLPKEHGAWAMLYVPFVMGVMVAGRLSWSVFLLGLSVTFLFIARESLLVWWRTRRRGHEAREAGRFMMIYLGLAGVFGAPLILSYQLWGLLFLALPTVVLLLINTEQAVRQEDRSVAGEILAILGLTLTAPAAHYAALGAWGTTALWLWALSACYFASSVFYVKLRVLMVSPRRDQARQQMRQRCAFYHAFLLGALLILAFTGSLNLFALVAFAPVLTRAFWHLLRPASQLNLRRVGVLEIIYSVTFLVFIALAFYQT